MHSAVRHVKTKIQLHQSKRVVPTEANTAYQKGVRVGDDSSSSEGDDDGDDGTREMRGGADNGIAAPAVAKLLTADGPEQQASANQ